MVDNNRAIIKKGNAASKDLGDLTDLTSGFSRMETLQTVSGHEKHQHLKHRFLALEDDYDLVSIPVSGFYDNVNNPQEEAFLFVENAVAEMKAIGATPVAITDVLEMQKIEPSLVNMIKEGLFDGAKHYGLWIANGETAGLGGRVTGKFNISGLIAGIVKKRYHSVGIQSRNGIPFYVHDHQPGQIYFFNADGNGTKIEWNERQMTSGLSFASSMITDGAAMLRDDAAKLNAQIILDTRVLELPFASHETQLVSQVEAALKEMANRTGVKSLLRVKDMTDRIAGYGVVPMNMSGTTVSVLDLEGLSLPKPSAGHELIGLFNLQNRNLRSNGISDQRRALIDNYGYHWHTNKLDLLGAVAAPSTIFYPLVRYLFSMNQISYFGHMSGGAYEGKLAKVLGKWGLGGQFEFKGEGFETQELLVKLQGKTLQEICEQQPYRIEAWVTSKNPERVMWEASKSGYCALPMGRLEKMNHPRVDVTFTDIGKKVSFQGYEKGI